MDAAVLRGSLSDTLWFWDISQQIASLARRRKWVEDAGSWASVGDIILKVPSQVQELYGFSFKNYIVHAGGLYSTCETLH